MALELTPAQIDQFNEDGYLIVDKLIDDQTVEAVSERYEKLFRGEFETGILPDEVNWQEARATHRSPGRSATHGRRIARSRR